MGMEQDTKEVVLTYETLYEILRKEKIRQGLQKVDDNFITDVLTYLKDKQQSYDDTIAKNDIFSQSEREKLATQIKNAKKIIRDLYDLRERKIINMGINHSRTQSHIVDTEHLLQHEKQLFESIHSLLNLNRQSVLKNIMELRIPEHGLDVPIKRPAQPVQKTEKKEETGKKSVKFLEDVEQFVGEELELYGPYKAKDSAQLPQEVAEVLIRQGKAAEL